MARYIVNSKNQVLDLWKPGGDRQIVSEHNREGNAKAEANRLNEQHIKNLDKLPSGGN